MADNSADEIVRYYSEADEASRLCTGWFQLEQARTQELILRHIPPAPATVLDIGGGAGAYACWLAAADIKCISSILSSGTWSKPAPRRRSNRNTRWLRPLSEMRAISNRPIKPWMQS